MTVKKFVQSLKPKTLEKEIWGQILLVLEFFNAKCTTDVWDFLWY